MSTNDAQQQLASPSFEIERNICFQLYAYTASSPLSGRPTGRVAWSRRSYVRLENSERNAPRDH